MKEIKVNAQLEELDNVLAFLEELIAPYDCSMKIDVNLHVAVEEMFVNIAHYAYPDNKDEGWAIIQGEVKEEADGPSLYITFIDAGIYYDPLAKPDPDVTLSLEERQIGGLGIYMVKKSMDNMIYERKDDKNYLTIVKKLE